MKNVKFKAIPFGIITVGIIIVIVGAFARISKESFAGVLLLTGMVIEFVGMAYFVWLSKATQK